MALVLESTLICASWTVDIGRGIRAGPIKRGLDRRIEASSLGRLSRGYLPRARQEFHSPPRLVRQALQLAPWRPLPPRYAPVATPVAVPVTWMRSSMGGGTTSGEVLQAQMALLL